MQAGFFKELFNQTRKHNPFSQLQYDKQRITNNFVMLNTFYKRNFPKYVEMVRLLRKSQSCRHRIEYKQKIKGFYYRLSFGRHLNSSFQRFHLFFSIWQTNWQTLAKNCQISGTEDLTALDIIVVVVLADVVQDDDAASVHVRGSIQVQPGEP